MRRSFAIAALTVSGVAALAQGQSVIVDSPATSQGAAAMLTGATIQSNATGKLQFHLSAEDVIQSVSFDAAASGAQELTVNSVSGCAVGSGANTSSGTSCVVDYEVAPVYAGLRAGTLRVVTGTGAYTAGVSFQATGPQVAFKPGIISTLALEASKPNITAVALDAAGNFYVTEPIANQVKKIDAKTGAVTVIAGNGKHEVTGDGGLATEAGVSLPMSVAVAPSGDVYIVADDTNTLREAVRKVDAKTGLISTVFTFLSEGRYGSVVADSAGNVYVSSPFSGTVARIAANGIASVGRCFESQPSHGTPYAPTALALDNRGNLYFADHGNQIEKVPADPALCTSITVVAGNGTAGYTGDFGSATQASLQGITGVVVDAAGNLYVTDAVDDVIREIHAATGEITTVAGSYGPGATGDGGSATSALLEGLDGGESLALDSAGDLYAMDGVAGTVRKIDVTSASVKFAPTNVGDFSSDSPQVVTVENIGNAPLTFLQSAQDNNPSITTGFVLDPSSNCGAPYGQTANSIAPGASCTELPGFQPLTAGTFNGSLTYTDNAGSGTQVVALSGEGQNSSTKANVFVAPNVIGFGAEPVGSTANAWTATLNNTSAESLVIKSITVSNPVFSFTTNCGTVLQGYSTCNLYVTFTPTAEGQVTGTLLVDADALNGAPTIALSGYGNVVKPELQLSPSWASFTDTPVGTTANPWTLNLSNTSSVAATISSITLSDTVNFKETSACGTTLAAYSSCNILVYFTPQKTGYLSGTLSVNDNGSYSPQTVALSGNGTSNLPTVNVSPTYIPFSSQAVGTTGNPWTVNVSNTSGFPLNVSGYALSDTKDFVTGGNCGATLAAYSSCNLTIAFSPKSTGTINGTLTISDDASPGTQTITMGGTGTSNLPEAFVSPSDIPFGAQMVGTTANAWTMTLKNTSAFALQVSSIAVSNPVFSYTTNCGSTLPAYSTCNLYVVFTPTSAGQVSGTLTVYDNTKSGREVATLSGYGQGTGVNVQLAPTNVNFSTQTVGTTRNPWTLNLSNMGGTALTVNSIALSDAANFQQTNVCGSVLSAYSSCNILVYFKPQSAGNFNANLVVTTNGNPTILTANLSGYAAASNANYSVSVNPSALSLWAGQTGNATFTFSPTGGYTGSVAFACSGLPNGAACSFSPAILTANGSDKVQTSQLSITTAGVNVSQLAGRGSNNFMLAGLLGLGSLAFCWKGRRRSLLSIRMGGLLSLLILASLAAAMGCGGGELSGSTHAGTSTVTVNARASAGTETQTASFTLIVTP